MSRTFCQSRRRKWRARALAIFLLRAPPVRERALPTARRRRRRWCTLRAWGQSKSCRSPSCFCCRGPRRNCADIADVSDRGRTTRYRFEDAKLSRFYSKLQACVHYRTGHSSGSFADDQTWKWASGVYFCFSQERTSKSFSPVSLTAEPRPNKRKTCETQK